MRSRGGTFEQGAVRLVRHDRCALVNRCADATHVVPMMVHRDDGPNWLAGNHLLRLREHRECARLAVRRVDEDDVILHFDRQAVMSPAGEPENAIGEPLCLDLNALRRWRGSSRYRDVDRHVGLHLCHREIKGGKPVLLLNDVRREPHPSARPERSRGEILVVAVFGCDDHVAHDRLVDPGLNAVNLTARVQVASHFVLAANDERDINAVAGLRDRCMIRECGGHQRQARARPP